jgi:hypothetical protein
MEIKIAAYHTDQKIDLIRLHTIIYGSEMIPSIVYGSSELFQVIFKLITNHSREE